MSCAIVEARHAIGGTWIFRYPGMRSDHFRPWKGENPRADGGSILQYIQDAAAATVTMVQRSPTYIASMPAQDPIAGFLRRLLPRRRSGPAIRWFKALATLAFYGLSRRKPDFV